MASEKILVSGCELISEKVMTIDFYFENVHEKYFLLKGFVLDLDKRPVEGAAVEVYKVQAGRQNIEGLTFTDEEGRYGISLPIIKKGFYKIIAYSK